MTITMVESPRLLMPGMANFQPGVERYRITGGAVTAFLLGAGDRLEIIDPESWIDYLHEFRTRAGLLYSKAVKFVRGNFESWDAWDPAIRCLYSGRAIYDPERLDFRDRRGDPLDLHQQFDVGDDPACDRHLA